MPTNKEFYEALVKDTARYESSLFFYTKNEGYLWPIEPSSVSKMILKELMNCFTLIGPMNKDFITDKNEFYSIPLARRLSKEIMDEYIGFISTNKDNTIILRSFFDIMSRAKPSVFDKMDLSVIIVNRSINIKTGIKMVMLSNKLSEVKPTHYFEHPIGLLPFLALTGTELPDSAILLMGGKLNTSKLNQWELNKELTNLYNDYDLGNISDSQLGIEINKFY